MVPKIMLKTLRLLSYVIASEMATLEEHAQTNRDIKEEYKIRELRSFLMELHNRIMPSKMFDAMIRVLRMDLEQIREEEGERQHKSLHMSLIEARIEVLQEMADEYNRLDS